MVINVTSRDEVYIVDRVRFDNCVSSYDWPVSLLLQTERLFTLALLAGSGAPESRRKILTVRKRRRHYAWMTIDVLVSVKYKDVLWGRCRRLPGNLEHRNQFAA